MSTQSTENRRIRATIIGFGLDDDSRDRTRRIITGDQCLLVGGSAETYAEMVETMLRLDSELERLGQDLGDLAPDELAEVAWRIDSPELEAIAHRLDSGLRERGLNFHETTAEVRTELAYGVD